MEFPKWLVPFRDNPEFRKSFIEWADNAVTAYSQSALFAADDMTKVLGLRYAAGEILTLKNFLVEHDVELTRQQEGLDHEVK